ncbi:hypothetical protein CN105_35215, partial [Sinorhizobium meliloti]|uniref:hypothetical protein n=1 Tax=Rhizobium meliloti TaxID=382 RepID=UPI000FE05B2C
ICHANLQIVLETFSHAQPASKYSLSNGAETALTAFRHCLVESMSLGRLLVDEGLHALEAVWAGIEVLD